MPKSTHTSAFTWKKMVKHLADMELKIPSNESLMNDFSFFNNKPLLEFPKSEPPMTRFQTFAWGAPRIKPDPRMHIGVDMGSPSGDRSISTLNGLRIFYSEHIMDRTGPRLFPESRHRSKRILKKLIKRFGGEFELAPAIIKQGSAFYVHPHFKEELEGSLSNA